MEIIKHECPECGEKIPLIETGKENLYKIANHRRHLPSNSSEGVHLRNIVDEPCPGSGKDVSSDSALELKISLLHECLTFEGAKKVLSDIQYEKLLEEVHEGKPLRLYIENLVQIGPIQFWGDISRRYNEALLEIRKLLLGH